MFRTDFRLIRESILPKHISDYEQYRHTSLYKDIISLTYTCLHITCSDYVHIKKYLVLNSYFGTIGEVLLELKRNILLTSPYEKEFFRLKDEFKEYFKQLDWKNDLIQLEFIPHCIIDYNLIINNNDTLEQFYHFLEKNRFPILISFIMTPIQKEDIIQYFENKDYVYRQDYINDIKKIINNKIENFNLDNLYILTPKPQEKQYAWNS